MLSPQAAAKVSRHLSEYAKVKAIFMKINFVNADHVHALIDLPTNQTIENVLHLLKGESSHWINENRLVQGRFSWGRGYGVFSVSQSHIVRVAAYIANQEAHHRKKSFQEEYLSFVERYGLTWRPEQTVETV